ncbi:MAG: hypothetical protein WA417_08050 [Stellaceae bacterium]
MSGRPDTCITEHETPHGYWWRYTHSEGEPEETWIAASGIAASVAADQARERGKTYLVSLGHDPRPFTSSPAIIRTPATRPSIPLWPSHRPASTSVTPSSGNDRASRFNWPWTAQSRMIFP